jgi:hypothetical protein
MQAAEHFLAQMLLHGLVQLLLLLLLLLLLMLHGWCSCCCKSRLSAADTTVLSLWLASVLAPPPAVHTQL